MTVLAQFAGAAAEVIGALHQSTFPKVLTETLMNLTGAEDGTLLWFRDDDLPEVAFNTNRLDGRPSTLASYLQGSFLLDPFYRAATAEGQRGVFALSDLAPVGFRKSEYFRTWYTASGFTDECGVLVSLPDGFLHFTLTTMTPRYRFTPHRLAAVSEAFPAVEALAQCHWSALPKERQQPRGLRQQLQLTLAAFGKSLLTLREQEVIELVLLGHSTPRIAEHFQLSVETVKLHRKNAYAKLEVNSQAELFHLFMDCMLVKTTKTQEDPVPIVHSKRAERG